MTRTFIRVPRYLVPVAKRIRAVEKVIDKGLVIDSPTVKPAKQPDGRIQLKVRPRL